jgi:YgiT-type zinc finger domain-containing protein
MPEKNADEPLQHGGLCPECQTGAFHLVYLTYFTWLNDELVTVPNFPAWVCDVCGRRNYDPRAIIWLNTLLHPETGRRSAGKKGPRPRRNRPAA